MPCRRSALQGPKPGLLQDVGGIHADQPLVIDHQGVGPRRRALANHSATMSCRGSGLETPVRSTPGHECGHQRGKRTDDALGR